MNNKVLYIPTARKTFDMDLANEVFQESTKLLRKLTSDLVAPEELLTDVEMLEKYVDENSNDIKYIIFQSVTFTDGDFMKSALRKLSVPVILWGITDPTIGGRLRLNGMTGLMSNANVLHNHKKAFLYAVGDPKEKQTQQIIEEKMNIIDLSIHLKNITIGVFGTHPAGFEYSDVNLIDLNNKFGTSIKHYELYKMFKDVPDVKEEAYKNEIAYAEEKLNDLNPTDDAVITYGKVVSVLKSIVDRDHLSALAIRDWPDFFEALNAAADGVISHFTDQGIISSCESDIHGVMSMIILYKLANNIPYLGDIVNVNYDENAIVAWHTYGAYSLANPKYGAKASVHPNRKVGLSPDFALKPGEVTMLRLNYDSEGYRIFISKGEVLDTDSLYNGTSAKVKLDSEVTDFMDNCIIQGLEPHIAFVHGDVADQVEAFAKYMDIPVFKI